MNRPRTMVWPGTSRRIGMFRRVTVPGLGTVLGAYLWEFLTYNQDFVEPQMLETWQAALLVLVAGPVALTSAWLLSSAIGGRFLRIGLREALTIDAPSYWPVLLLAVSPTVALLAGRGLSAYQALVVVPVSGVWASGLGVKAWCWTRAAQTRSFRPSRRFYSVMLGGAVALFVIVIGMLALLGYGSYSSWYLDMGLVDQALWNTLQGRFMEYTFYEGIQMSLLADHVEPILIVLVPLYALWSDPRALLVVRVLAVGLAALPLYGMAHRELGSRFAALCIALAYLAFPMVVEAGIRCGGNIRTDALALPFLASALYSLKRESWPGVFLWLLPAMACKEHIALLVAALGIYLLVTRRHRSQGVALLALGLTWFVVAVWIFLPWMRGGEQSRHFVLSFSKLGGDQGVTGIVETILTHPAVLLETVLIRPKLDFVFFLLLSLGFLPLLGGLSVVVLPIYGLFLLYPAIPSQIDYHYLVGLPFLLGGASAAIGRLSRQRVGPVPAWGRGGVPALAVFLLTGSLAAGFFWGTGPLSWSFWRIDRPYSYWGTHYIVDSHTDYADRVVAQVPSTAPGIASDYLLIRLSQRPAIYHFFWPPAAGLLERSNWVAMDLFENHIRTVQRRANERAWLRELLSGGEFGLTAAQDGVLLFVRNVEAGLYSQAQIVEGASPEHVLDQSLGQRLRLLGYDLDDAELATGRRHQIRYYWQVLPGYREPFSTRHSTRSDDVEMLATEYVLIDTFTGPGGRFRVFHLPTYALLRPETWQADQVIQETYEFVLPETMPAGNYEWTVGLYTEPTWFGIRTDADGQVPGIQPLSLGRITLRNND